MMTLIEEMRQIVLELWQAMGMRRSARTAAAVVPALVVGVVLNVVALNIAGGMHLRLSGSTDGGFGVTQTDVSTVQAVLASTLDKGRRGLCLAQQWIEQQHAGTGRSHDQASCGFVSHGGGRGV
jgi:hypothetical protein